MASMAYGCMDVVDGAKMDSAVASGRGHTSRGRFRHYFATIECPTARTRCPIFSAIRKWHGRHAQEGERAKIRWRENEGNDLQEFEKMGESVLLAEVLRMVYGDEGGGVREIRTTNIDLLETSYGNYTKAK